MIVKSRDDSALNRYELRIRPHTYHLIMHHVRKTDAEVFASSTISKRNVSELEQTIRTIHDTGHSNHHRRLPLTGSTSGSGLAVGYDCPE